MANFGDTPAARKLLILAAALLFIFGAGMLAMGAVLSLLLPKARRSGGMVTQASLKEDFRKVKDLLRKRGLITAYSSIFAQYFAFGGVVVLLPLHVVELGMSAFHVGILLAIFSLTFVIVQFPGGAISDRTGRLKPAVIGLSLCAVAPALLSLSQSFTTIAIVMAFYGAAFGMLFPSLSALLADSAKPEEYGRATGIFHALITIGVAVGAPVIGWIASFAGVTIGLSVSFVIFIPGLVLIMISLQKERSYSIER